MIINVVITKILQNQLNLIAYLIETRFIIKVAYGKKKILDVMKAKHKLALVSSW